MTRRTQQQPPQAGGGAGWTTPSSGSSQVSTQSRREDMDAEGGVFALGRPVQMPQEFMQAIAVVTKLSEKLALHNEELASLKAKVAATDLEVVKLTAAVDNTSITLKEGQQQQTVLLGAQAKLGTHEAAIRALLGEIEDHAETLTVLEAKLAKQAKASAAGDAVEELMDAEARKMLRKQKTVKAICSEVARLGQLHSGLNTADVILLCPSDWINEFTTGTGL